MSSNGIQALLRADLSLYNADSLVISSSASLLSTLTYNTASACVCGIPAGGNEQPEEDHLAWRRN